MPHEWQPLIGPMFFTRPTDLVEPRMRLSHPITSARHLLYHCLYQSTANLEKALWQSEAAVSECCKCTCDVTVRSPLEGNVGQSHTALRGCDSLQAS
eukprot:4761297-Pyramimonas_sp.AAC.1